MVVPASEAVTEGAKGKEQAVGGIRVAQSGTQEKAEGDGVEQVEERLKGVTVGHEKKEGEGDREDERENLPKAI